MFLRKSSSFSLSTPSTMKLFPTFRIGSSLSPSSDYDAGDNNSPTTTTPVVMPIQMKDPARFDAVVAFARMSLPESLGLDYFNIHPEKIEVKMLTGGTSNQLYHVYSTEKQHQKISATSPPFECVIRVFGDAISQLVDREAEVFWQSKYLKTFGKCANGIAFEFLRKYKPLPEIPDENNNNIQDHVEEITRQLAELHTLHLANPKEREEIQRFLIRQKRKSGCKKKLAEAMLTDWLDLSDQLLEKVTSQERYASNPFLKEIIHSGRLREEANQLLCKIQETKEDHITVPFTHNDANPLNIMMCEKNPGEFDMKLIDFEYAGRNYVQFEIGTHFNEWSGLECDYSKFPNEQEQVEFLKLYFKALKASSVKYQQANGGRCLECGKSFGEEVITVEEEENKKSDDTHNNNEQQQEKMILVNSALSAMSTINSSEIESSTTTTTTLQQKLVLQQEKEEKEKQLQHSKGCFCHLLFNKDENQNIDDGDNNGITNKFETFRQLCLMHAQVAHIGWAAWSIFQAATSEIEGFDYVEYSELRWKEYLKNKKNTNNKTINKE